MLARTNWLIHKLKVGQPLIRIMNKKIFIGPIIKQKLDESPYTVAQFAREIGHSRKYVYNLFEDKSIDIDLLCEISELLNYNFLNLYFE